MAPAGDFVLWSNLPDERTEVRDSDIVFAGYGVVAPEYKWDDYAGNDVTGKTVMVITGDPPVANPRDPTKLDEHVFLGNALTVYGRNGTKLESAFRHGAAAVLLVPPARPFRYVWENNARENMTLRDGNEHRQLKAQGRVARPILSRSLSMPAELIVGDHRISEYSPVSSPQGAGGMPAPKCTRSPTRPTGGRLFAEHPARGFCCLAILDDRIQFNINQVAPIVHMLGEGGHIVRFQDMPAQNRAGHMIPSNLCHSLGRRTAGFQKLLKRRLVEARARSPRKHEFHGYTLLT